MTNRFIIPSCSRLIDCDIVMYVDSSYHPVVDWLIDCEVVMYVDLSYHPVMDWLIVELGCMSIYHTILWSIDWLWHCDVCRFIIPFCSRLIDCGIVMYVDLSYHPVVDWLIMTIYILLCLPQVSCEVMNVSDRKNICRLEPITSPLFDVFTRWVLIRLFYGSRIVKCFWSSNRDFCLVFFSASSTSYLACGMSIRYVVVFRPKSYLPVIARIDAVSTDGSRCTLSIHAQNDPPRLKCTLGKNVSDFVIFFFLFSLIVVFNGFLSSS